MKAQMSTHRPHYSSSGNQLFALCAVAGLALLPSIGMIKVKPMLNARQCSMHDRSVGYRLLHCLRFLVMTTSGSFSVR